MSAQRNLILAVVLSMIVVFGWQYLVGVPKMQEEQAHLAQQQQQAQLQSKSPSGAPTTEAPKPLPRAEAIAQSSTRTAIETPTLAGTINLAGGRFDDLRLRQYRETPDPKSPEIELLSPMGSEHPYIAEFGWLAAAGENPTPGADTPWKLVEGDKLAPGSDIELAFDNGKGLTFTRRIAVDANYMFTIIDAVDNHNAQPVRLAPYALVLRANPPVTPKFWVLHEGFVGAAGILHDRTAFADLDKDNMTQQFQGTGGWWGITDKYWMAAAIPPQSEEFAGAYKAFDLNGGRAYQADYLLPGRTVMPNGSQTVIHHLFAGAKVVDLVDNYRDKLGIKLFDYTIDWGTFWFLTRPIFIALDFLYRYVGNFGIAILLLALLVKAAFYPFANRVYRSMIKMQQLEPQIEDVRQQFPEDWERGYQELRKLYKRSSVGSSGLLPVLLLSLLSFLVYKVLVVTIDMRHAPFFGWIKDLSTRDPSNLFNLFGLISWEPSHLPLVGPFLVLGAWPALIGLTTWIILQQNIGQAVLGPLQRKALVALPFFCAYSSAALPTGVVTFLVGYNLLSIGHQRLLISKSGNVIGNVRKDSLSFLLGKYQPILFLYLLAPNVGILTLLFFWRRSVTVKGWELTDKKATSVLKAPDQRVTPKAADQMAASARQEIINDYGALIERAPPSRTRIEDVSALPHPKQIILDAFLHEIALEPTPKRYDVLRHGAMWLAQYQPGVGSEALEMLGFDITKRPELRDLKEWRSEAKLISEAGSTPRARFDAFNKLVEEDLRRITAKIVMVDESHKAGWL